MSIDLLSSLGRAAGARFTHYGRTARRASWRARSGLGSSKGPLAGHTGASVIDRPGTTTSDTHTDHGTLAVDCE